MKKYYYIYLNGKRYLRIPEGYNIQHDIYMQSSPSIDKFLGDAYGRVMGDGTILIKNILVYPERYKKDGKPISSEAREYFKGERYKTIQHELRHMVQQEQSELTGHLYPRELRPVLKGTRPTQVYDYLRKRYGYREHPFEVEAREWGEKDILYKQALERVKQSLSKFMPTYKTPTYTAPTYRALEQVRQSLSKFTPTYRTEPTYKAPTKKVIKPTVKQRLEKFIPKRTTYKPSTPAKKSAITYYKGKRLGRI